MKKISEWPWHTPQSPKREVIPQNSTILQGRMFGDGMSLGSSVPNKANETPRSPEGEQSVILRTNIWAIGAPSYSLPKHDEEPNTD